MDTILGSTYTVIHSVNQRLPRNRPGSGSCDLSRLLAQKITKGIHSCQPASLNCPIQTSIHGSLLYRVPEVKQDFMRLNHDVLQACYIVSTWPRGGGGEGYGGVGRGRLYTNRYTVTTRMTSALRWAAMRAILISFIIVRDKVTRQCPQITTFEVKGEPKQIRTEVPLLTSLPPYR